MNGITLHEAVTSLVDAEVALARHLDELGVVGITDNPGARTSYGTDLFNAMCMVVCIDAESSGQNDLLAALGCDQVCGEGWSWDENPVHGDGSLPHCECGVCEQYRRDNRENDEPDIDDDFPMSVEYDGLWGASDWAIEESAQREAEYEAGLGY